MKVTKMGPLIAIMLRMVLRVKSTAIAAVIRMIKPSQNKYLGSSPRPQHNNFNPRQRRSRTRQVIWWLTRSWKKGQRWYQAP